MTKKIATITWKTLLHCESVFSSFHFVHLEQVLPHRQPKQQANRNWKWCSSIRLTLHSFDISRKVLIFHRRIPINRCRLYCMVKYGGGGGKEEGSAIEREGGREAWNGRGRDVATGVEWRGTDFVASFFPLPHTYLQNSSLGANLGSHQWGSG